MKILLLKKVLLVKANQCSTDTLNKRSVTEMENKFHILNNCIYKISEL